MYTILDMKGTITGYHIGGYYLTPEKAKMFVDSWGTCNKMLYGIHGDDYIQRFESKREDFKSIHLDIHGYPAFCAACEREGIKLHDIVFVPCHYTDFDLWESNSIWKLRSCCLYQCMRGSETLGYLLTDKSVYSFKNVMIIMIEMVEKRRGHGGLVIEELKSRGIHLSGLATVNAVKFWKRHGAVLQDNNRFVI